jgi:hypothetical protein
MDHDDDLVDVQAFLREHITSYEQLEISLLLQRDPSTAWTPAAVAAALSMSQPAALAALEHLERLEVLRSRAEQDERVFSPCVEPTRHSAELERLSRAYEQDRTRLMRIMNRNAIERVRARAMQAFTQTGKRRGEA